MCLNENIFQRNSSDVFGCICSGTFRTDEYHRNSKEDKFHCVPSIYTNFDRLCSLLSPHFSPSKIGCARIYRRVFQKKKKKKKPANHRIIVSV